MADSKQLLQRIARLAVHIQPTVAERDIERCAAGIRRKRRQRTVRRIFLGIAAVLASTTAATQFWFSVQSSSAPHIHVAQSDTAPAGALSASFRAGPLDRSLRLKDGSVVTPLNDTATHVVMEHSPQRIAIQLERGHERFNVARVPNRSFLVYAGDVLITVVGTAFTVERVADRVGVFVEHGTVRVDWETGTRHLHEGESGWFPPLLLRPEPAASSVTPAPPPPRPSRVVTRDIPPQAEASDNAAAAASSAEGLISAADDARLAGRPEEGAKLLYRLLREHGSDPRAPLAAFTLGRTLMMELGRPREAASAFAKVRSLAPFGPFAEDALAREVEAWAKAQRPEEAQARAREYIRLYPRGRRINSVKMLGGLMQEPADAGRENRVRHGSQFEEPM